MKDRSGKAKTLVESLGSEFLFGSVYLLRSLSEFERNLRFYKRFYDKPDAQEIPVGFIEGFKFALMALLHLTIVHVIESPDLVGVRRSGRISWAYSFGRGERSKIHKLPDNSSQGILVDNLLTFRKQILGARNWKTLKPEVVRLIDFISWFRAIFLSCYAGYHERRNQLLDPENALKTKLPGVLLVFLNDGLKLSRAFSDMYRLHASKSKLVHFKRIFKQYPDFHEIPLDIIMKDKTFFEGYKFANISLWNLILGEGIFSKNIKIFDNLKEIPTWRKFDLAFGVLNKHIIGPLEKYNQSNLIELRKVRNIPKTLSKRLIVPIEKPKMRRIQLADVLKHRSARVVSFEGSNGAISFCTVLSGLVYQQLIGRMKEKAQVIEFIHKQKNRGSNYSYALLLPCSSELADYSRWWIFYNCATDYSGAGGFNYEYIHGWVKFFKEYIHYRKFNIKMDRFFNYLKSDYVKFIEEECKKATNINSLMRGAILELLVAFYFVQNGFRVLVRHRSKVLGKEIDVVAVRHGQRRSLIYVVECKERSVTADHEEFDRIADTLLEELRSKVPGPIGVSHYDVILKVLQDFNKQVNQIREKLPAFMREIEMPYTENTRLKGVLVTTELFKEVKRFSRHVELWTWWTLKRRLAKKLDKSYLEIVEKHLEGDVGKPIIDLYFYKDYFD